MGIGSMGFLLNFKNFQKIIEDMTKNPEQFKFEPDFFLNLYGPTMVASMAIAGIITFILTILVYPVTYGLINKKYETGSSNFSDMTSCLSKYIGRYILCGLLGIAIGIGATVVFGILIGIGVVVITTVSKVAGIILIVLLVLAFIVGCIALGVYMSLWFPAICVEDSGIIQGLKNSFKYVKGSFWTIIGITLLVSLCSTVAQLILGAILGWIPIIGSVVAPAISAIAGFIIIVFYFEIYREKSGRFAIPETFGQIESGVQ